MLRPHHANGKAAAAETGQEPGSVGGSLWGLWNAGESAMPVRPGKVVTVFLS